MKKNTRKKRILIAAVCSLLFVGAVLCFIAVNNISHLLLSQQAAERWRGGSDMKFAQVSCFLPVDQTIQPDAVNKFRQVIITKAKEASINVDGEEQLFVDAWSTSGKVSVSSALGKGDVYAYAVGGDFFHFHPLTLKSGSYIGGDDLMKDRVLLDEDTAWLLFGSDQVQGMSFRINGEYFVVAGVVERESDFATKKAYSDGMGIFMSYDAYADMVENTGISCYEVVMPEPVRGFALSVAQEKFPIGRGEIICNSTRFSFGKLLKIARQYGMRSMQNKGIIYPYWENAARYAEDIAALLTATCLALAFIPAVTAIVYLIKSVVYGKKKLESDILPELRDNTEEAIRARQYRRMMKKKKKHQKNAPPADPEPAHTENAGSKDDDEREYGGKFYY